MRRLLVVILLLLPTLAQARPDGDPDWRDDPEGDHNFMLDRDMVPTWRRDRANQKAADFAMRKRAAEKRKRKARKAQTAPKPRPPTPHPAP